jgi:NAD(P) transhydrogenase
MSESFDLVVIGCGPAGEKGAAQAAYFGRRVALVERDAHLGGAGVNTGTVPSKTLRETALYFSGLRQRGLYGIDYSIKPDITVPDFMHREQDVVQALRAQIAENVWRHQITLVRGDARFVDPHTVRITAPDGTGRTLEAPVILIATGSYPNWPDGMPHDAERLFDSDSILHMQQLPRSLAVSGGGVIGCEYATMFRAMGIDVTLVCGSERLLPFVDAEIGERLRLQLELLGLRVKLGAQVADLELLPRRGPVRLRLTTGDEVEADNVLFATGRMGNTGALGLEQAGLTAGRRGHLQVNDTYQTAVPHIYAAGDVVGFPALASTSMDQARVAMCHAFGIGYKKRLSSLLPMAIYTIPEIAAVGETEESCREKGIAYAVGRALYERNARGQIIGDFSGLVKLVFAPDDLKLLGVHIIGEMASELVHVGQACLHYGGSLDFFIQSVFNYPTLSEAYKYAAYDGLGAVQRPAPDG